MRNNVINATWRFVARRMRSIRLPNSITPIPKQKLTKKLIKQIQGDLSVGCSIVQTIDGYREVRYRATEQEAMAYFANQHYGEFLDYVAKRAPELFNQWADAYWRARPHAYACFKQQLAKKST
jgi:hypothetical protein